MKNRFIPIGKPVTGTDLVGREQEIQSMLTLLEQGQSIVLLGSRRMGKTSIMLELLHRMHKKGCYTLHTDIFTCPTAHILADKITSGILANRKLDAAFASMKQNMRYLVRNVQFRQVVEDNEFILGFAEKKDDGMKLLNDSVDFLNSFPKKYDKNLVAGFDEFGDIDKYNGGSVSKMFRAKLQLQQNTQCIFSGSYESVMNELFLSRKSPFYRFARIIKIGPVPVDSFKTYFNAKLKEFDTAISAQALETLMNFTAGHPYYTQLAVQQSVMCSHGKKVEIKDCPEIISQMISSESGYLERCWEELVTRRENIPVLMALAQGEKAIYSAAAGKNINVSRSLKNMINTGLVENDGKGYKISDPLFIAWIKENIINKTHSV